MCDAKQNGSASSVRKDIEALYLRIAGVLPERITPLPGAGSDRKYYRVSSSDKPSIIATFGENVRENRCFVALSDIFKKEGIRVPEVYAVSNDGKCYLQEDLGGVSLFDKLFTTERMVLSEKAMTDLVELQTVASGKWEGLVMNAPFSTRQVKWDLNYFKYEFLKPAGIDFDEDRLEDDFEILASRLVGEEKDLIGFMYRDCQSRNVIIRDNEIWWIDFQGGRKGPLLYDAVSFLWQAKAKFTPDEREFLLEVYATRLEEKKGVRKEIVLERVNAFAFFRTLQVLGAYGFRGLVEKKAHFIESIPDALRNLRELLATGVLDGLEELKRVCELAVSSRFASKMDTDELTVTVYSFSYKRGYPEDLTGNGGGFMFDCRGIHNPGRYEQYRSLTGLDSEVVAFLEEKGEVQKFVDNALEIVVPTVERYIKRGFSSLQVGFGCTGGQHRSVYCARRFGALLHDIFPNIKIIVIHREQQ